MEEVIKYFESLEARLAAAERNLAAAEERLTVQEKTISAFQGQVEEMLQSPLFDPQVTDELAKKVADKLAVMFADAKQAVVEVEKKPVEIPEAQDIEVSNEPESAEEPLTEEEPVEEEEPAAEEPAIEKPVEITREEPEAPETKESPASVVEEKASPKAAIYGKAVDDIRLAISLGDRFLYQRELFGQNAELMQHTLTELNELDSFEEAMDYITNKFSWDTESNTYQQFLVTLHRRFG